MPEGGKTDRDTCIDSECGEVGNHSPALLERAGEQGGGYGCHPVDNHAQGQHPDQAGRRG